jgi:nitrogen fixation/metabolism regulation signal transduction histidine kinase
MLASFMPNKDDEQKQLTNIILRETTRLNRLVTDFLSYARPGHLRKEKIELHSFIEEIILFFKQGEGRENFTHLNQVPKGISIEADREQLEQLFLNLYRNSKENSSDSVIVTTTAHLKDTWVIFDVIDDGNGMDPKTLERAFEPFFSSHHAGTGLGLACVERIGREHGGSVTLHPQQKRGLKINIKLPL